MHGAVRWGVTHQARLRSREACQPTVDCIAGAYYSVVLPPPQPAQTGQNGDDVRAGAVRCACYHPRDLIFEILDIILEFSRPGSRTRTLNTVRVHHPKRSVKGDTSPG